MILKFVTVCSLAGFAAVASAQPVELMLDERALNHFDVPPYVADAGVRSISYFPFEQPPRIAIHTRFADLTCEFQDASGTVVAPPFSEGNFVLEIDRIPTPFGESDPNVASDGQPIDRDYPLDTASGSISQMLMDREIVLDICTSGAACEATVGESVQLFCREAGTAVFGADFEPPILNLIGDAATSTASAVAGQDGFNLEFSIENTGDLDAEDLTMRVLLDALPQGVSTTSAPNASQGTFDAGTEIWDVGLLEAGATATLDFSFSVDSDAIDAEQFCGSMALDNVSGDPTSPGAADAGACVELIRQVDLTLEAIEEPKGVDPVDVSAGDVSFSYLFGLENVGPSDASGVAMNLEMQLPPGVTVDQVTPFSGTFDPQTGVWTLGVISSGSLSRQIRVDVTVAQGTTPGADVICAGLNVNAINEQIINPADDSVEECTSVISN